MAISQYNCTDTMRKNLTVFDKPIATISPNITSGCSPLAVNFGNGSQGQDSCNWNFGDGTIFLDSCGVNLTHIFENNFSVAPISSLTTLFIFTDEGCKDTTSQIITIDPKVTVGFSAPTEGCSPFKGKAKAIFWEGETLYKNGDLPNAINQWKLIYETEEEYALLNYYLGDSYFQLKQYSQAIWYLNKTTIINDAYYEIAYSHLYQGEYLAAASAYGNYTWRTESKFSYHEVIQLTSNIANYAQFVNNQ